MPYGPDLERVVKQEEKVVKRLQKQDWKGLLEDTTTWTQQVRTLAGYSHTTYDPARFRTYCDQLLVQTQSIRDAALHQDPVACNTAILGCDPVLNRLSSEFPPDASMATVVASPPPAPAPAPSRLCAVSRRHRDLQNRLGPWGHPQDGELRLQISDLR